MSRRSVKRWRRQARVEVAGSDPFGIGPRNRADEAGAGPLGLSATLTRRVQARWACPRDF
jgi:hypothetical protein